MIIVVLNIISNLKPLLSVYILILMIIIIFKIYASPGVVVLILYDTVMSNETVKDINVVLINVYPFNGKCTMTFVWLEDKTIYFNNGTVH